MLYVVGGDLPKTDFLTKIDAVIVITTCLIGWCGIASLIINKIHDDHGADAARDWNRSFEFSLYIFCEYC